MRIAGLVAISFLALLATAVFAVWWGGFGAMSATHPSLANAKLPPLISVGDFYADTASEWGYEPSPGGKYLMWWDVEYLRTVIRIRPLKGSGVKTVVPAQGATVLWARDDTALYVAQYETSLQRHVLWRIDPANPDAKWQDVTPRGFNNWWLVYRSAQADGNWLVSSADRAGTFSDIYSVQSDGLGKRLVGRNDGTIMRWLLDLEGEPELRIRQGQENRFGLEYASKPQAGRSRWDAETTWRQSLEYSTEDEFAVLSTVSNDKVFAQSRRGRDKAALVLLDLNSGSEEVISEDPVVDLGRTFFLGKGDQADIAEFASGYRHYVGISDLGKKVLELLGDRDGYKEMNLLGKSEDGRYLTFAVSELEDSWQYFLLDTVEGRKEKLGEYAFARHKSYLAETQPVTFKARDGLEIPALLTIPHGVEPKNLPTIVMIHGGPAANDKWGYNHDKQFLANRGYAILSVNFRGSTGYGRAFQEKGFRQFGRAMQDDIADAAKWLVAEGIADPGKIASFGASYGGYSALMAVARDPDLFTAAVSIVGASDLEYQTRNAPGSWSLGIEYWTRYFGSSDNAADVEEQKRYSPVNLVSSIRAPVFLSHGILDNTVDRAQSEAFEKALSQSGKEFEAHYFEKEGHGYRRWQTKVLHARAMEDFLARNLGGRSGGFHYSQWGAKLLN